ncbi:MAG: hypothetical protein ABR599_11045 [Gemmatimonadota bacterium]
MRRSVAAPLLPAVLLGTSGGELAAVRALGRRGVPVWIAGPVRSSSAVSRFTRAFLPTPHPVEDADGLLTRLLEIGSTLACKPVLLPIDDLAVETLARHAGRLAEAFRLTGPAPRTALAILDKGSQYARVEAAGIPLPRTWVPEAPDGIATIQSEARFPVVVKGRSSHRFRRALGFKALQVGTPGELPAALHDIAPAVVVQELVPGGIENVYEYAAFVDRSGRTAAAVLMRKLDEDPTPYGSATAAETLRLPVLEELGRRVLDAFDYRGISHSEFKLDPRDGSFRFIELNPRIPVSLSLQAAAGADTVWPAYAEAAGLDFEPVAQGARRVLWLRPELRLTRHGRLFPPRLPDSPAGPTVWVSDLIDPADPAPLASETLAALRKRLSKVARRIAALTRRG